MDLHEQRQLDEMARQMAKVRARTRPWRVIIALVLAAAAGIVASVAGRNFEYWTGHGHVGSKLAAAVAAVLFCLFALIAILALARRARQALQPLAGSAHAAVVRYSIVLFGAILTLANGLALFKIPVGQPRGCLYGRTPGLLPPAARCRYSSDTTYSGWVLLAPLLPAPTCQGRPAVGRKPTAAARTVEAIRYLIHNGCVWRALPADFPPWRTVYGLYQRWDATGVTIAVHDARYAPRAAAPPGATPSPPPR